MAISHKKFSAHRFFDAFQGFEDILELFVRQFNGRISVMPDAVSIESLKTYLASDSHDEGRSDFVEALYLIYDMSFGSAVTKEKYHEEFAQACVQMSPAYEPDPEGKLPLECLAMKVWSENRVAFDIAYTMHAFHSVDGFSEFKGPAGCEVGEPLLAADYLQTELERVFADNKKSDRVKVSFYHEQESINFIIYHEKRTIAELVFDDGKNIKAEVLRPLQQDFIGYSSWRSRLLLWKPCRCRQHQPGAKTKRRNGASELAPFSLNHTKSYLWIICRKANHSIR